MDGHASSTRDIRNEYNISVGNPEVKGHLRRPEGKGNSYIKTNKKQVGGKGIELDSFS